jgi:hypothetical protein
VSIPSWPIASTSSSAPPIQGQPLNLPRSHHLPSAILWTIRRPLLLPSVWRLPSLSIGCLSTIRRVDPYMHFSAPQLPGTNKAFQPVHLPRPRGLLLPSAVLRDIRRLPTNILMEASPLHYLTLTLNSRSLVSQHASHPCSCDSSPTWLFSPSPGCHIESLPCISPYLLIQSMMCQGAPRGDLGG